MTAKARAEKLLKEMRNRHHPDCVLHTQCAFAALDLQFSSSASGGVEASFMCAQKFQGYAGRMHGGVLSLVLDAAMTNCLFAQGIVAVTADLRVRFRHPVTVGIPARVHAYLDGALGPLHSVRATIEQEGSLRVTGHGKFMQMDDL